MKSSLKFFIIKLENLTFHICFFGIDRSFIVDRLFQDRTIQDFTLNDRLFTDRR